VEGGRAREEDEQRGGDAAALKKKSPQDLSKEQGMGDTLNLGWVLKEAKAPGR